MQPQHSFVYRYSLFLIFLLLALFASSTYAATPTDQSKLRLSEVIKKAKILSLAKQDQWLYLNHYRVKPFNGKIESYIDDPDFFIASDGKFSPESELKTTLEIFHTPMAKNSKGDFYRCRYQARYEWLDAQLNLNIPFNISQYCNDFSQWYKALNPGGLTLIYPGSYINSPSSMFGHTLLRIDPPSTQESADLISYAINFGANLGDDTEQDLFFAYRGLAGGYPGQFVVMPYHKKVKEYSKMENRDIWEYKLNLTTEETRRFVLHLWEVSNSNFDYYYIDENCSFRLLEMLDVARQGMHLSRAFPVTAIPNDTVRIIVEKGLVASTKYRASIMNTINHKLTILTPEEHDYVEQLNRDIDFLNNKQFSQLSAAKRHLIIDTAYQIVRQQQVGKGREGSSASQSWQLLIALNKTSHEGDFNSVEITWPQQPDLGHKSTLWSIKLGQLENQNFADFRARLAYHDISDNNLGYLKGAQISFFDLTIRTIENDKLSIENLDIVNILSLSPGNRFFPEWSWKIQAGLQKQPALNKMRSNAIFTEVGAGSTHAFSSNNISYALLLARMEINHRFERNLQAIGGIELGHLWYQKKGIMHLKLRSQHMINTNDHRLTLTISENLALSQNRSLAFSFKRTLTHHLSFNENAVSFHQHF